MWFFPPFYHLHCDLWWCSAQLLCMAAAWLAGSHTHCSSQDLAHQWHRAQAFNAWTCHFFLVICHHLLCALVGLKMGACRMKASFWSEDRKEIPGLKELEWSEFGGDFILSSGSFISHIIITELIFLKRILASGLDCQEKNIN